MIFIAACRIFSLIRVALLRESLLVVSPLVGNMDDTRSPATADSVAILVRSGQYDRILALGSTVEEAA
jgi:hypothetical protein